MEKEPRFTYELLCNKPPNETYWCKGIMIYYLSQSCELSALSWANLLGLPSASWDRGEVSHVATFSWGLGWA